jgi:hypothetical protein
MPICVVGMPHSGMSMVGRALSALGVDLGPESELPPEAAYADPSRNARFARINDAVLEAAGAAWNSPPESNGSWAGRPELEPLKREARSVSDALALAEPWGWVDPANSLTLPFWRELFPDLQVLVCMRHPLELARALDADGAASAAEALELWRSYYGVVDALGDRYVVTDLSRYAADGQAELERIAQELHLSPSPADVRHALATLEDPLEDLTGSGARVEEELPAEVGRLYARLLEACARDDRGPHSSIAEQRLEIAHLRRGLERSKGRIEDLRAEVEANAGWQRERDELLANLEEQLLERDEELRRAWEEHEWRRGTESSLREENSSLRDENEWLREKENEARRQFDSMQQTRLWRLGTGYWSLKARVGHRLRRAR